VARQGAGELEAVHLRAGPGSRRPRPGHGTCDGHLQRLPRPAPADEILRARPRRRTRPCYQVGTVTGSPALSASATAAGRWQLLPARCPSESWRRRWSPRPYARWGRSRTWPLLPGWPWPRTQPGRAGALPRWRPGPARPWHPVATADQSQGHGNDFR